ncbi:phosphate ABC transporter permease PstA [Nocardioides sp. URHA0020]|uniref:phosphate ABC transporter permease PstA n=1 Tax=Nocardioides sp. URHA0020 TaxID=1380392 RepID=UPI000AA4C87D|nr:phosphate ABC transporter permease PstA [Nocardioides sp. URHA0020]
MTATLPPPTELRPVAVPRTTTEEVRRPSHRTPEDRIVLVAALAGSVATTWLLYFQILPYSSKLGFVLVWYAVFALFYGGLTKMSQPWTVVTDRLVTTLVIAAPTVVGLALLSTVVMITLKGLPVLLHWNFFTEDMAGVRADDPFTKGGIAHAIVGTLIQVIIAVVLAMPFGVATAVYMSEVGGRGARLVRTFVEAMTALPSIVAGLFIYTVFLVYLGMPSSGFAAALALSVMAMPIMARASYVVLGVVPGGLREASYALGAGKWQTVWRVVLPTARPGLATALILGVARVVGETSPLLLVSGASTYFNTDPFNNPMNSLPLYVYTAVSSGNPTFEERGYAAATVLLAVVLGLFVLTRFVAKEKKSR